MTHVQRINVVEEATFTFAEVRLWFGLYGPLQVLPGLPLAATSISLSFHFGFT
jgi:hypothetical protein